jgi:chaperonin GroEL (HSP60 family)
MDKMIQSGTGEVVITNDGATILKKMSVMHPAAKMVITVYLWKVGGYVGCAGY